MTDDAKDGAEDDMFGQDDDPDSGEEGRGAWRDMDRLTEDLRPDHHGDRERDDE